MDWFNGARKGTLKGFQLKAYDDEAVIGGRAESRGCESGSLPHVVLK
jgi:hypothetical protein